MATVTGTASHQASTSTHAASGTAFTVISGTSAHAAATATQNGVGGTVTYDVEYRLVGGATTTVTGVKALFLDIQDLSPGSNYEWRVRKAVGTDVSAYSAYQRFRTESAGTRRGFLRAAFRDTVNSIIGSIVS